MSGNFVPIELITGVGDMDAQHEHLFSEIERVKNAFLAVSGDSSEGLQLLAALADDLVRHYAWEEAAARRHGIAIPEHEREHARMARFVVAKIAEIEQGICNIPAFMVFMERKFESHVAQFDVRLAKALQAASGREQSA